jgi:hypothetical protein
MDFTQEIKKDKRQEEEDGIGGAMGAGAGI